MIVVTGATGKLGRFVITGLLEHIPAEQITAAVRSPEKAQDLAAKGVQIREADYDRPETMQAAFAGADKVLLVSGSDITADRVAQHQNAINAVKNAGVELLAYTSILRADTSRLKLAEAHRKTEQNIRSADLPFVFLRNGWYFENQTAALGSAVQHGTILGTAGEGRFASASIVDYAAAAVTVLTQPGQEGKVYELAGDTSYTLSELAVAVSEQAGKSVSYNNLPPEQYQNALEGFGLPLALAEMLVDAEQGAEKGELDSTARDLHALIGRPTTALKEAVARALSE